MYSKLRNVEELASINEINKKTTVVDLAEVKTKIANIEASNLQQSVQLDLMQVENDILREKYDQDYNIIKKIGQSKLDADWFDYEVDVMHEKEKSLKQNLSELDKDNVELTLYLKGLQSAKSDL